MSDPKLKNDVLTPLHHLRNFFRPESKQLLGFWLLIAILNFITQIIFRRDLAPGEFGLLNTALGFVALMTVPLLALNQAFTTYLTREHAPERQAQITALRASFLPAMETFALIWGSVSLILVMIFLPLLGMSRFSLNFFTLLNVFIALGTVVSAVLYQDQNRLVFWAWLLTAAALERLLVGSLLSWKEPWAEAGLAAFGIAGIITLKAAVLRPENEAEGRAGLWRGMLDRDFLLYLGATFSVLLALFLFSSADRVIALGWFAVPFNNNFGFVDWTIIDSYQTAGLLARALIWGLQPLLVIFYLQRSRLSRTTRASLKFFWIYLGALFLGAIALGLLGGPLSHLFCGDNYAPTAMLVPNFAVAILPLGALQALGTFALASRRYHECFVLGGASLLYLTLLELEGRQPQWMLASMFSGGVLAILVVLFVGIVRWGRKNP